jgi:hypothetical protein
LLCNGSINKLSTIRKLFSMGSVPRCYLEDNWSDPSSEFGVRVRCSKGTPIIKKPNPSLSIKGGTRKKKRKVLALNKYMAMGPSGAGCQE